MKAGRHEPLLEVEPLPGAKGRYQIVCGKQRWRAAREAGRAQVLVRVHPHLGYLERLEKQYEENRLRADLDPVEEAHLHRVTWNTSSLDGAPATGPGADGGGGRALDPSQPGPFVEVLP